MSRKVYVELKVLLVIRADDDADIHADVLNEMDYNFASTTDKAEIEDSEILDADIVDSK